MFYEINVSLNGRHLFATAERSLTNREDADFLWSQFKVKFPPKDGYQLSLSERQSTGRILKTLEKGYFSGDFEKIWDEEE